MSGFFISLEGIEGSGKSTQGKLLGDFLRGKGIDALFTEEPGGTEIGNQIRSILLSIENRDMSPITELLLYNASRAQHVEQVIRPALKRGVTVITDRFSDSTVAYQGYGRGIDLSLIDALDVIATGRLRPHLTVILDLDVGTGLRRNRGSNKTDRIEREEVSFHERVRRGYQELASREPTRIRMISASGSIEETHAEIVRIVSALFTFS